MSRGSSYIRSVTAYSNQNTNVLPGVPLVEICDRKRVLVENHQGILYYGSNEIQIKVRDGHICVIGENLKLNRMSKVKLVITGDISAVNLRGKG